MATSECFAKNCTESKQICPAIKHQQNFARFLAVVESNPDDFETVIDRLREKWESKQEQRDQWMRSVRIDGAPTEGMQSSKTCMFQFGRRQTCLIREVERCQVSL
eukprot:symbB.v1.2.010708.t1/scaffold676.1/size173388/15